MGVVKMSKKEKKQQLQNEEPNISNHTSATVNKVAKECTQSIFRDLIEYDNYKDLSKIIANQIRQDLEAKSFMTSDVALSEKQSEVLDTIVNDTIRKSIKIYLDNVNKLERAKKVADNVVLNVKEVIEQSLAAISYEINRGFIIKGIAVSCSAKNDDYNEINFRYGKKADASIPTQAIMIATNSVEDIAQSIAVEVNNDVLQIKYNDEVIEIAKEKKE